MNLKKHLDEFYSWELTLDETKQRVASLILILFCVAGIPVMCVAIVESYLLEQYRIMFSYVLFLLPVILITIFQKRISYNLTTYIILLGLYILGVVNLATYSISGAAVPIFLTLLVLTTVFYNAFRAIIALFICVVSMVPVGYLFITRRLETAEEINYISTRPISWITAGSVLFLLGAISVFCYGIIKKKMLVSAENSSLQSLQLEKLNLELQEEIAIQKKTEEELLIYKDRLEQLVRERTAQLTEKNEKLQSFVDTTVEREFRIKELSDEIEGLKYLLNLRKNE